MEFRLRRLGFMEFFAKQQSSYIYIYIYIERERERERFGGRSFHWARNIQ